MSLLALLGVVPGPAAVAAAAPAAPASQETVGTLTPQNATFAVFVQGRRIGTEQLSVERTPTELVVRGSGRLLAPVDLTLRSAEIRYGLDLSPRSATIDGWLRDHSVNLSVRFEGTTAFNAFEEDGKATETEVAVAERTVVLPETFFGAYVVLAARLARAAPGDELRAYIAPQGELSVVLNEVVNERVQVATRSFDVRRHRVTFRNPGAPFDAEIETEDGGALVRITLPAVQLQVSREDVASVAARQQRFTRDGDEDVRIGANGFSLAATISRPATMPPPPPGRKTTRLPAIVLVPDSAPVDRDHFIQGVPVLGQLAAGLADAGFLVVRYDKRGLGQSGGREEAATLADYADDVVWTVRWLRERRDVDPKDITVVGYGDGAWVSLLAAAREKKVTRVVLVAAAGTPGAQFVLEQQQAALSRAKVEEAEKRRRMDLQQRIHAALLGDGDWSGVPEDLRRQADSVWFASFLAFDPIATVARTRQPLLIVVAGKDAQVPAHHAEKLVTAARARKKNPGATVVAVPDVTHLLVAAPAGAPGQSAPLAPRQISAEVATAIASWIRGT